MKPLNTSHVTQHKPTHGQSHMKLAGKTSCQNIDFDTIIHIQPNTSCRYAETKLEIYDKKPKT